MATAQKRSAASRSARARAADGSKQAGQAALKRLDASLEAAQQAAKDLSGELSRSGKGLFGDVQKLLADARRHTRRMSKTALKDLDQLQEAVRRGRSSKPGSARTTAAKRRSASSGTSKRATGRRAASGSAKSRAGSRKTTSSSRAR
jgi:hypothetical protein